jgi:probable non-F420 flavinoid oxidoreductase
VILYHASHEQFPPGQLLQLARLAEQCGFEGIHSSDHFFPWSERQGQSAFSFAWMGAAMQATSIPCGMICAPGQRYHPAIVAQAAATLAAMFPGRYWLELGSGEALNEKITGGDWPLKAERNQRLKECADIIRRLMAGETVTHTGTVTVHEARLYTRPEQAPPLIGAALSVETAEWMGGWADGMVTISKPAEELKELVAAFRRGGGAGKPLYLKVQLSYHQSEQAAVDGAYDQWRTNVLPGDLAGDMWKVSQFDAVAEFVRPEDVQKMVHISARLDEHLECLKTYQALGFDHLILHNVNREQEAFIKDFGAHVLPALKSS